MVRGYIPLLDGGDRGEAEGKRGGSPSWERSPRDCGRSDCEFPRGVTTKALTLCGRFCFVKHNAAIPEVRSAPRRIRASPGRGSESRVRPEGPLDAGAGAGEEVLDPRAVRTERVDRLVDVHRRLGVQPLHHQHAQVVLGDDLLAPLLVEVHLHPLAAAIDDEVCHEEVVPAPPEGQVLGRVDRVAGAGLVAGRLDLQLGPVLRHLVLVRRDDPDLGRGGHVVVDDDLDEPVPLRAAVVDQDVGVLQPLAEQELAPVRGAEAAEVVGLEEASLLVGDAVAGAGAPHDQGAQGGEDDTLHGRLSPIQLPTRLPDARRTYQKTGVLSTQKVRVIDFLPTLVFYRSVNTDTYRPRPRTEDSMGSKPKYTDDQIWFMNRRIEEVIWLPRIVAPLHLAGYHYIWQLVTSTEATVLAISSIGRETLNKIKELLGQKDLTMGMQLKGIRSRLAAFDEGIQMVAIQSLPRAERVAFRLYRQLGLDGAVRMLGADRRVVAERIGGAQTRVDSYAA